MHATSSSARRSPDRRAVAVAVVVIVVYGAALVRGERSAHVAASLQEIHAEPDDVVGERGAVSAEVQEVLSEELILIGGPEYGVPLTPVLLTSRAREIDDSVRPGDVGQFVGQFRRLDVDALERQVRRDLPDERLERLEEGLLLVADPAAVDQRAG